MGSQSLLKRCTTRCRYTSVAQHHIACVLGLAPLSNMLQLLLKFGSPLKNMQSHFVGGIITFATRSS